MAGQIVFSLRRQGIWQCGHQESSEGQGHRTAHSVQEEHQTVRGQLVQKVRLCLMCCRVVHLDGQRTAFTG